MRREYRGSTRRWRRQGSTGIPPDERRSSTSLRRHGKQVHGDESNVSHVSVSLQQQSARQPAEKLHGAPPGAFGVQTPAVQNWNTRPPDATHWES
jgi:hypothetical protein